MIKVIKDAPQVSEIFVPHNINEQESVRQLQAYFSEYFGA